VRPSRHFQLQRRIEKGLWNKAVFGNVVLEYSRDDNICNLCNCHRAFLVWIGFSHPREADWQTKPATAGLLHAANARLDMREFSAQSGKTQAIF
jgi:hypothetical protein